MKPRLVDSLRRHQAKPAHHLAADRYAASDIAARETMLLRRGKHCRNDHGPCMHGAALEGIVVILTVRGSAVAHCSSGDVEAAGMPDESAASGFRCCPQRRL